MNDTFPCPTCGAQIKVWADVCGACGSYVRADEHDHPKAVA